MGLVLATARSRPEVLDWSGLTVSVDLGVAFIALSPIERLPKIIIIVLYVPISTVLLFYFTAYFVGYVYGIWL